MRGGSSFWSQLMGELRAKMEEESLPAFSRE
jgi:hypothetical protein